jgi:signal transduction histidine kinase
MDLATQYVTIDDLKKVIALGDLPDEHLQWILDHSEYRAYTDGELIAQYGEPAEIMWIMLAGKVVFYLYVKGRQVYYFTFENSHTTGGIGGLMPYSRMKTHPGYSYAMGEVKTLRIHKRHFAELEHLNPEFIQKLIGYMTERARAFATMQLQYEKVNALGNLAAGIAHELNNPAAAISGISGELKKRLNRNYELTKGLLQCNLTAEHIQHIRRIVEKTETNLDEKSKRSTLQRMNDQDEIEDWLEQKGITARETAETFSEYGFSTEELETMRGDLGTESFARVISWLENLIASQRVIKDLADASARISTLVTSIKTHVHMDRADDLQHTDVHRDIENTITLLGFKIREKNIEVIRNFCSDMPEVPAYVGELNQVWTNLIDNAIFAMEKKGVLNISSSCDEKNITVTIVDNGAGISKENLGRIFDPFFSTKKVGEGTGIGLDIVNRIIKHHNGEIKVKSEPGRTEFTVCLPLAWKTM